jgi:hypothetical protein
MSRYDERVLCFPSSKGVPQPCQQLLPRQRAEQITPAARSASGTRALKPMNDMLTIRRFGAVKMTTAAANVEPPIYESLAWVLSLQDGKTSLRHMQSKSLIKIRGERVPTEPPCDQGAPASPASRTGAAPTTRARESQPVDRMERARRIAPHS